MLRVTTLHASCAAATAAYYAQYLTGAPGEVPGVWSGRQAGGLGLSGRVEVDALESLLSGRDAITGTPLGRELLDRYTTDGRVVRAVSGFDATFSAPKSLSVWWALSVDTVKKFGGETRDQARSVKDKLSKRITERKLRRSEDDEEHDDQG